MNTFKVLILTTIMALVAVSNSAVAHIGGHEPMGSEKVVALAQTSAKMLTFNANEMTVGKLDQSWTRVEKSQFILVAENKENFIAKVTNAQNNQTLYFRVSKDGIVSDVAESASFEIKVGHKH